MGETRVTSDTRRSEADCPFCALDPGRIWLQNEHALALWDGFPVSEGHTLVVPRRHLASLFEASEPEYAALWKLAAQARSRLQEQYSPDGFTIGVNDGPAAGQTVEHAHIHVIPRRKGDVPDPRGGIRWVIPERAGYAWKESSARAKP